MHLLHLAPAPTPATPGFHDVLGNAWEWGEDHFSAFPGFRVHPIYEDFSVPCFGGKHQMVRCNPGATLAAPLPLPIRGSGLSPIRSLGAQFAVPHIQQVDVSLFSDREAQISAMHNYAMHSYVFAVPNHLTPTG